MVACAPLVHLLNIPLFLSIYSSPRQPSDPWMRLGWVLLQGTLSYTGLTPLPLISIPPDVTHRFRAFVSFSTHRAAATSAPVSVDVRRCAPATMTIATVHPRCPSPSACCCSVQSLSWFVLNPINGSNSTGTYPPPNRLVESSSFFL